MSSQQAAICCCNVEEPPLETCPVLEAIPCPLTVTAQITATGTTVLTIFSGPITISWSMSASVILDRTPGRYFANEDTVGQFTEYSVVVESDTGQFGGDGTYTGSDFNQLEAIVECRDADSTVFNPRELSMSHNSERIGGSFRLDIPLVGQFPVGQDCPAPASAQVIEPGIPRLGLRISSPNETSAVIDSFSYVIS